MYSNPNGDTEGGQADENSDFYLPYSYFGYDSAPPFNYVIGTLKGGERKYQGLQVTLQKQKSNNWQGMLTYTYNDAEGNSNSAGNADIQGDWIPLDPRAPNPRGPPPGHLENHVPAFGTQFSDYGLGLSPLFTWTSGPRQTVMKV